MDDNFAGLHKFLLEVDKMKQVYRQTYLIDRSRQENDAEHSWHFALTAMVLYEYADKSSVNLDRVIKMALVHDIVEIDAGDTFAHDDKANESKAERELNAADRLFSLLPKSQGVQLRALWEEFEAMDTPDALYANAIDRLQSFINIYATNGLTWQKPGVTSARVLRRMEPIKVATPALWPFVEGAVRECIQKGYLIE